MIVNRFDSVKTADGVVGVGGQFLERGCFDPEEVARGVDLLVHRRQRFGDGVVALDCGANIGAMTVPWAVAMTGWGRVIAFEPQERIYYALCGNITLSNCFNAEARLAAVGNPVAWCGECDRRSDAIDVPQPNYLRAGTFGSLELRRTPDTEYIGQPVSYAAVKDAVEVPLLAIDDLRLSRVDLIKIDVERMELDALRGAVQTIERCRPTLIIEWIKVGEEPILRFLEPLGYDAAREGISLIAEPR